MAKVTGPLFSMTAKGAVGKALVYSKSHNIKTARFFRSPSNPRTVPQQELRNHFTQLAAMWNTLLHHSYGPLIDYQNLKYTIHSPLSPYNLFMQYYMMHPFSSSIFSLAFLGVYPAGVPGSYARMDLSIEPTNAFDGLEVTFHAGHYPYYKRVSIPAALEPEPLWFRVSVNIPIPLDEHDDPIWDHDYWVTATSTPTRFLLSGLAEIGGT